MLTWRKSTDARWSNCCYLPTRQNAAEDPNLGPAFANAGTGRRGMDCRFSPPAPRDLVSEYQSYDFRAIARPLTKKEMAALRSISTRAAITTTSFTNHYEWGDLKANPSKIGG